MGSFAAGLLTTVGGAAEGAGIAIQNDALTKLKNEAMMMRDKQIAKLRGENLKASDEREFAYRDKEYSRGLLDREEQWAHERTLKAGDTAMGMVKEYNDSYNRNLKTLSNDGMDEITPQMRDTAEKMTDRQFQRMGLPIPGATKEGASAGPAVGEMDDFDSIKTEFESASDAPSTELATGHDPSIELTAGHEPSAEKDIEAPKSTSRQRWQRSVDIGTRSIPEEGKVMDFREQKRSPGLVEPKPQGRGITTAESEGITESDLAPEKSADIRRMPKQQEGRVMDFRAQKRRAGGLLGSAAASTGKLEPTWQAELMEGVLIAGNKQHGIIIKLEDGEWIKPSSTQLRTIIAFIEKNPSKENDALMKKINEQK